MSQFESSEILLDKSGVQYHIGLGKDDISDKIIVVGDHKRAKMISGMFDRVLVTKTNREYITYTGIYKNLKMSVMATGMSAANMEIAVIELCQLVYPLTIIRCGTCGALNDTVEIGDFIISSGALRLENTVSYYVEDNYPALASYEVSIALLKETDKKMDNYHYGITATAPGFYGAQCRNIPGFYVKDSTLIDRLKKQNVKNMEMETSTLFTLANVRGFRAGCICVAIASRNKNKFADKIDIKKYEKDIGEICLEALVNIEKIDKAKNGKSVWIPEF